MSKLPTSAPKPRHNQWTRQKMVLFLRELAATQSVSCAARHVGMSRTSAYTLRNRLRNTPFDLGWEVALEMGFHQLAHAVMDRAINGMEEPRFYHGELVGTVRKFDNRLATWVLSNPWSVGRSQVAREYSSAAFDRLLERIEVASLDWEAGEGLPGTSVDLGASPQDTQAAEGAFVNKSSWYAADAAGGRKRAASR
ncbi:hypothetical protein GCM10009127_16420 [Alteraurantiacibacter aestuarii]|uniref:LysR family transcriptional regulator n=1 Tax=Alteraurantiacibacter aestuarii TaxID=650004 RepID=A0A844ZKI4_9SPHN|nr:hypothetical protein [Alteraurantiacibacter aestuarii]MXO87772.1 hypothetical protein [Alteraurantiacibacter aestuarii]